MYLHEIVKLSYHSKHELSQWYIPPETKGSDTKEMVIHYNKRNIKILQRITNPTKIDQSVHGGNGQQQAG